MIVDQPWYNKPYFIIKKREDLTKYILEKLLTHIINVEVKKYLLPFIK